MQKISALLGKRGRIECDNTLLVLAGMAPVIKFMYESDSYWKLSIVGLEAYMLETKPEEEEKVFTDF